MLPPLKHLPVHWVNGMKISKEHFVQQELAFFDQLRDFTGIHLNYYNFGLLPPIYDSNVPLDIRLATRQNNTIQVKVMECRAITRGGARIEIVTNGMQEENALDASFALEQNDQLLLDVIVTINPFSRVPTGQPDPEESPLRYPFTKSDCKLEIIPSDQTKITHMGTYHLTVGKIRVMGDEIKLINTFIPPCSSLAVHPLLQEFHRKSCEAFQTLYVDAIQVVKKIKDKSEQSTLHDNILDFSYSLASFLSDQLDTLEIVVPTQPPVSLIILFKRLSRTLVTALNCMSSAHREDLFHYFAEHCELDPETFENSLRSMIDLEYDHLDIARSVEVSQKFISVTYTLFERLKQIGYVEKPKEAPKVIPQPTPAVKPSFFITEEPETVLKKKKGFWSFNQNTKL